MQSDTATLVRESWQALDAACFVEHFYTRLLDDSDATLARLFPANTALIRHKFGRMLSTLVAGLDDVEALSGELHALGARHVDYGVTREHYVLAGDALLATLRAELGPWFDPETERAWTEVYRLVTGAMLAADTLETRTTGGSRIPKQV